MLAKTYRLRERKDFRRVYQRGKSQAYPYFVLYYRPSRLPNYRIGFSVSKKQGNAVVRNRLKRRFREVCRLTPEAFSSGMDYIFIIRSAMGNASGGQMKAQLLQALSRIASAKGGGSGK